MFKNFRRLLAPFMLAPLGTLLINSSAHAGDYWTNWDKCYFNWRDYTWWSARIEVRSDGAARFVQYKFGNGNTERINIAYAGEGWVTGSQDHSPILSSDSFNPATTSYQSNTRPQQWLSIRLKSRYVQMYLHNEDDRICGATTEF